MTSPSHFAPFLVLAVYPTAFFLGFAINPIELGWGANQARNGRPFGVPMPRRLQDRSDALTRYLNFLVDALILAPVFVMSRAMGVSPASIGLQVAGWKHDAAFGFAVAVISIAVIGLLLRRVPIDPRHPFTYRVRKGSAFLWLSIFITGAFSEELWIAFCLVVFRAAEYPAVVSILMTMAVFAAMHYSYRFWGAVAAALKGTISALLFLHFGSLVVTFVYHFFGNLGSMYWNRYWRRQVTDDYTQFARDPHQG